VLSVGAGNTIFLFFGLTPAVAQTQNLQHSSCESAIHYENIFKKMFFYLK
jgi:hypothetical protein